MALELRPLPTTFAATRDALHRVAEALVAPARKPHNEIALRQTDGGFGTPPFEFRGERTQVRVEGIDLVLSRGATESRIELASLAAGGALLGPELLPDGVPTDEAPLGLDPEAADRLAGFYAFAAEALDRLKSGLAPEADASNVNLWPEHFDIALEAGDEKAESRANFGASPGDDEHADPYVYVGPWKLPPTAGAGGDLWNATGFSGAELAYAELRSASDPVATAVGFMRSRHDALIAGS